MNDHIFAVFADGQKPIHIPREQANRIVQSGAAYWIGRRKIKFNATGHRIATVPEFNELRADTSHWVGIGHWNARLPEQKQELLHSMKRL